MSTILDALRKSERERALARGVGFGDAGRYWAPPANDRRRWLALGAALGVVALAVLAWLQLGHDEPAPLPTSVTAMPVAASQPVAEPLPAETDIERRIAALAVTVHVYTSDPAQRILYIDNKPYTRGDEVFAGVVVEEITPDGVTLQWRDRRFTLPRPG